MFVAPSKDDCTALFKKPLKKEILKNWQTSGGVMLELEGLPIELQQLPF